MTHPVFDQVPKMRSYGFLWKEFCEIYTKHKKWDTKNIVQAIILTPVLIALFPITPIIRYVVESFCIYSNKQKTTKAQIIRRELKNEIKQSRAHRASNIF